VLKSLNLSSTVILLWPSRTRLKVTILSDREKAKVTIKSFNNAQNFPILENNKTSSSPSSILGHLLFIIYINNLPPTLSLKT
jgi:hypothetical protein